MILRQIFGVRREQVKIWIKYQRLIGSKNARTQRQGQSICSRDGSCRRQ
jgi:hypothetical protein